MVDELEVCVVVGQERYAGGIGRRGDGEIHRAPAGLAAALHDRSREPAPFASDGGADRERIEGGFDDAELLGAARPPPRVAVAAR
jgi:hypothetical protein